MSPLILVWVGIGYLNQGMKTTWPQAQVRPGERDLGWATHTVPLLESGELGACLRVLQEAEATETAASVGLGMCRILRGHGVFPSRPCLSERGPG